MFVMASQQMGYAPELGDWIDVAPWKSPLVVVVAMAGSSADWAGTVAGKRTILTGPLTQRYAIWGGLYATNVRSITVAEAAIIADRYFK